ncbi:MAG: hypothetical protein L0Z50_24480 [Verrucomicrobiales bacterium]|nr:hypothetical protein [Verrucomicrobiales bacterium]
MVAQQSADELAKQTQNPVASLISVPFQGNWDMGIGSRQTTGTTLNIQPVAPFALTKEWNVILRVIMPAVSQPTDTGPRINGMGDTVTTVFLSPARSGKVIWGAGPVLLVPTATNNALGTEKFGLGPSVVVLVQPGKWTVGMLWNQIWSVDGAPDRADVNQGFFQPFANYNLGDGVSLGASIEATGDWEAANDTWTSFLLFSASKVALLGKRPVNFSVGAGPAFASPSGGADWKLRLAVVFLFPR